MARVLIITADIGAGHDLPAELLRDSIRERDPESEVVIADALREAGRLARAIGRNGQETILEHAPVIFDAQYWLIARFGPTRRLGGRLAAAVATRGLLALIARERPDVIVSTYPGSTDVLGRLRRAGAVTVPCISAITDLAALHWWAHPGIDLHLITHAQSRAEVLAVAGASADVRHVRGFTRPEFETPPSRAAARDGLDLPAGGPVVVISGGGWGVGDLERAAVEALSIRDATVVCLCGSNARLRLRLQRRFAGDRRVRVEGFTTQMCDWLSAADVLVHSTAGLTVLEAELCGTWAVSYGWGVGHIRTNNRAYRRFGLAAVAGTPTELGEALRASVTAARPRPDWYAALPAAADVTLELVSRERPDSSPLTARAVPSASEPTTTSAKPTMITPGRSQVSSARSGANTTGTTVCSMNAPAATRAAPTCCSAPISSASAAPATTAVKAAQPTTAPKLPECEIVGQELRRQPGRRVPASGGKHQHAAREPATDHPGERRDDGQPADHREQRGRASVNALVLRRGPGQQRQPAGDAADRQAVPRSHRLVQKPPAQHEQQHQPQGERGLDDSERGDREGGDLQRPAGDRQGGRRDPAGPSEQAAQQLRSDGLFAKRARLDRLQRDRAVEAGRRSCGQGDPAGEFDRGHRVCAP